MTQKSKIGSAIGAALLVVGATVSVTGCGEIRPEPNDVAGPLDSPLQEQQGEHQATEQQEHESQGRR
jgi:hypothetical protein